MNRRDALCHVIDALHEEIAALKSNDVSALERATAAKREHLEALAAADEQAVLTVVFGPRSP